LELFVMMDDETATRLSKTQIEGMYLTKVEVLTHELDGCTFFLRVCIILE